MSRPNKCIKDENGREQWISRSAVVIPIVFKLDEESGDIFTLVEKRGPAVSHPGKWCCPCGYLDWDEDLKDACRREVKEETGLDLDSKNILFVEVDGNPKNSRQNIDLWHMCWTEKGKDFDKSKIETIDEILDVRWLKVAKVKKGGLFRGRIDMTIYKKSITDCFGPWAFKGHPVKIQEMLKMFVKGGKIFEVDE